MALILHVVGAKRQNKNAGYTFMESRVDAENQCRPYDDRIPGQNPARRPNIGDAICELDDRLRELETALRMNGRDERLPRYGNECIFDRA